MVGVLTKAFVRSVNFASRKTSFKSLYICSSSANLNLLLGSHGLYLLRLLEAGYYISVIREQPNLIIKRILYTTCRIWSNGFPHSAYDSDVKIVTGRSQPRSSSDSDSEANFIVYYLTPMPAILASILYFCFFQRSFWSRWICPLRSIYMTSLLF